MKLSVTPSGFSLLVVACRGSATLHPCLNSFVPSGLELLLKAFLRISANFCVPLSNNIFVFFVLFAFFRNKTRCPHNHSFFITQSVDEINFVCGRNNFRLRTKKISTADEIWPRHSLVTMRFANSHHARARHCTRQGAKIIYTFFPSERNYQ